MSKRASYLRPPLKLIRVSYTRQFLVQQHARRVHRPNLSIHPSALSKGYCRKPTAYAYESIIVTAIDETVSASATSSVIDDRLDGHPLTDLYICDIAANLLNYTAKLMAKSDWNFLLSDRVRSGRYDARTIQELIKIYDNQFW